MSPSHRILLNLVAALAMAGAAASTVGAAESAPSSPATPESTADTAAALASKASYQERISALESRPTPYDEQLSEAWFGLGTTLQILGEHEEALEALGNALQALRISKGLHDPQQLPVLQQQLVSSQALQQWEELDAAYHLIYYIAQKQFEPGNPLRFDALRQLGKWKLQAATENLLPGNYDEAAQAAVLYRKEISQIDAITGSKDQLATLYFDLAAVEFRQVQTVNEQPLIDFESSSRASTTQTQCQSVRMADGRVSQICSTVEVPNVNVYVVSSQRKSQEINLHLEAMRTAVMEGYYALQDASVPAEQRAILMPQMQQLTGEYNKFINDNTTADNPRLKP